MADLFSTNTLLGIIENLPMVPSFLLDRFFGTEERHDTEEIHFDKGTRPRKMAPFVLPTVEGQPVEERGRRAETFKPAYLKPKTPLDPNEPLKRALGETIGGGQLSAMDRRMLQVANTLADHMAYIRLRLEWMAAQVLRTGKITVTGERYPTVVVDFQRDAALTGVTPANVWSDETNADPFADLEAWSTLVLQKSTVTPVDVIMDTNAWKNFFKHPKVKGEFDYRHVTGVQIDVGQMVMEGATFKGSAHGFNLWVYRAWYEDPIDTLNPFLSSGDVILATPMLEGVQAFGAIKDDAAGYRALPFYPKSWVPEDPPIRQVMTQSAPLIIPGRVNASLQADVL